MAWLHRKRLDFIRCCGKKAGVTFRDENPYADLRRRSPFIAAFHDDGSPPPEKLLQSIWRHQRLRRNELKTADGRALKVLHPGFQSVEGGPDFRGAVLQIGDGEALSGDVEIDLQSAGWRAHGHDRNPHFKRVILHVVWDAPKINVEVPAVLAMKPILDAPVAELALALENDAGLPGPQRGKCCAPLQELNATQLMDLLNAVAQVRFENKASLLLARARHSGWEQALWEQLFRALGYKNNIWPMQNLAESKPRWARAAGSAFALQTRLLGVSGLLPEELTRAQKSSDTYLRRAWDAWWRDRDGLEDCILPRAVWKFHGLRPANHPQRRLALASHWLAADDFIPKLEQWCTKEIPEKKLVSSLHEIFQVERDDFWSWHWTFKSARMPRPQPLLGEARVTDLAVNVVLPWLWVRAREGANTRLRQEVERRFLAWPAAEDNSVLKLARQRLLGTSNARALKTAASQQGLMQIVRDFCEHSNAVCVDCRFPGVVTAFK